MLSDTCTMHAYEPRATFTTEQGSPERTDALLRSTAVASGPSFRVRSQVTRSPTWATVQKVSVSDFIPSLIRTKEEKFPRSFLEHDCTP